MKNALKAVNALNENALSGALNATEAAKKRDFPRKITIFLRKIAIFHGKSRFSPRNNAIFSPNHFPDTKNTFFDLRDREN